MGVARINEVERTNSISRALASAQGGLAPDESTWRRAFGIPARHTRPCCGSDCRVCQEIARVQEVVAE